MEKYTPSGKLMGLGYKEKNDLLTDEEREEFDKTEIGQNILKNQEIFNEYRGDEMNPAVISYWLERGLKKELFDRENIGKYSVFTPINLKSDEKLPLMYICHGNRQPIQYAETYGYNSIAAEEKFMAVYPQHGEGQPSAPDKFKLVLEELEKDGFPVNWERVYVAGFAGGSDAAVSIALEHGEKIATIAPCPGGHCFSALNLYKGTEELKSLKNIQLPTVVVAGTKDGDRIISEKTTEEQLKNRDIWIKTVAGAVNFQPVTLEKARELTENGDDSQKAWGLNFDCGYTFKLMGADWYSGDFYGRDGHAVARFCRTEGVSHDVHDGHAKVVWNFVKSFKRNADGGWEYLI